MKESEKRRIIRNYLNDSISSMRDTIDSMTTKRLNFAMDIVSDIKSVVRSYRNSGTLDKEAVCKIEFDSFCLLLMNTDLMKIYGAYYHAIEEYRRYCDDDEDKEFYVWHLTTKGYENGKTNLSVDSKSRLSFIEGKEVSDYINSSCTEEINSLSDEECVERLISYYEDIEDSFEKIEDEAEDYDGPVHPDKIFDL